MDEDAAFVREIRAHPADETPRLIYADYLEENGDVQGELIRIQCTLRHLEAGDAERAGLMLREQEILNRHAESWIQPLRELGAEGLSNRCFHGGLIEQVTIRAGRFADVADELCRVAPGLHRVQLRQVSADLEDLLELNLPPQVVALDLSANGLGEPEAQQLARAAWTRDLREINLQFNQLHDSGVEALSGAAWDRMETLRLGINRIGPDGVRSLTQWTLPRIRLLSLRVNPLGDAGTRRLAGASFLTTLEELDLARTGMGEQGAAAIAQSYLLESLKRLNLRGNQFGEKGCRALAGGQTWNLAILDIRGSSGGHPIELVERYGEVLVR